MNNVIMVHVSDRPTISFVQNVQIISDTLNLKGLNFCFHVSAYINFSTSLFMHHRTNSLLRWNMIVNKRFCVNYFSDMSFVDFNSVICNNSAFKLLRSIDIIRGRNKAGSRASCPKICGEGPQNVQTRGLQMALENVGLF